MRIEGTPKEIADFVLEVQNRQKQENKPESTSTFKAWHSINSDGTVRPPYSTHRYKVRKS